MRLGPENLTIYPRKLGCSNTRLPLGLDCTVDRCGDRVFRDEVAVRQFDLLLDATSDSLPATPCGVNAIGRRRGDGHGSGVWVAQRVGVDRPRVNLK
jgi:hypothetical protein